MKFPLVKRLNESANRSLIVGWLGLLAITVAVFVQFQELSNLAQSAFELGVQGGIGRQGSMPSAIFQGIFPHALSTVAIVSVIGMVTIEGPTGLKSLMLGTTLLVLVVFEYHWPANWATADELRVIASLTFVFLIAAVAMSVVAVGMRAFFGWHFVVGTQAPTRRQSISISELIALTGLAACTIAIGRQTHFPLEKLWEWSIGSAAYAGVLSLRLLSLADDAALRRQSRVLGILFFAGLQLAEASWPFSETPDFSFAVGIASGMAALASAIIYWFMTALPILWMKVNDWHVIPSPTRSFEPDVDRTTP